MLFKELTIKNMTLKNRTVLAPMCMYMAEEFGYAEYFHMVHYVSRSMGGVGLIIQEATAIDQNGRISPKDLGIWRDNHVEQLKMIVDGVHKNDTKMGIQINHAGRKGIADRPLAPSAIQFNFKYHIPKKMTIKDIKKVIEDFKQAARRANEAGYDYLEIHAAHGYLLCEFLSPNTNKRKDEYGDRKKLIKEVVVAVREEWPEEKPLAIRFSASEYVEEGITPEWIADLINELKPLGLDIANISSGGNVSEQEIKLFPGYQLDFAKTIRSKTGIVTIGGGLITNLEMADKAIIDGSCDLVYFGRLLLREPFYIINHAENLGEDMPYPKYYKRAKA
ncbi:NADH:flavin oxidoreductase/NADH oxidase [Mariniplasma anaerobium]|uniref:NADPH dehydrogenase n=1 Tax=Mariniplasma anaerobium TaxID=2735436 RepID=A0A7U9TGI4_9MOLU|nr:NADH:flavin oxidoreductase/NADH oxidase [Mariniplasma anaerobium]BCR35701.1 NADPH dehydrogenase [Mariniplasma anaerobium]